MTGADGFNEPRDDSSRRRHDAGKHADIRRMHEGECDAEFRMTPRIGVDEVRAAFANHAMGGAFGLRYSIHRVRDFQRPSSMQFLKTGAREWPWNRLLLPWHTDDGHMRPSFPRSVEDLWDPGHARDMESTGRIQPRIDWGNAYEHGRIVDNSSRHMQIVSDVMRPADDFLDAMLADDGESAVSGIFLVHEHMTDVWFPITDQSVIQWHMRISPTFRESTVKVMGGEVLARRMNTQAS